MATLQKIRTQGGLFVAIIIGLALVAFILGDLFQSGTSIFTRGRLTIGTIKGETVQYPEYLRKVEELADIYRSNTGQTQIDEETWVQLRDQAWETMIREKIMGDIYKNLGIGVSSDEMLDMIQGDNIHPIVRQIFTNPQTGEFERSAVINFVRNLDFGATMEQRNYWLYLERQIMSERMQTKYNNLVAKALYVTNDEAQFIQEVNNINVSLEFISLNFNTVDDSQIEITDRDLRNYYNANKDEFSEEKTRRIQYIVFDVTPSSADFSSAENWINDIKDDFTQATDNVQFITANSDASFDNTWYKAGTLPENLDTWIFDEGAQVNDIFGPYFENNSFRLARFHASEMMPDSVEARHILLPANTMEEALFAQMMADSLKGVIEAGGDFGALAREHSIDTGSAINGGDLGWFRRGMMVAPFEEAAFNSRVNEVTIVNTQFGIHIVQTTRRGALSRQVQVAVLERSVVPSTLTYQAAYAKASRFVSDNTTQEKFNAAVEAENLTRREATLRENDRTIAGLEMPRPLIRAAFEARVGSVLKNNDGSPIFELGDNFVVATLAEATEDGTAPFESVRTRAQLAVEKQKKGELIAEKFRNAAQGTSDMYEIATAVNGNVNIASNINFNSATLPGSGVEPRVIGKALALPQDIVSGPIVGNNGVFLVKVTSVEDGGDLNLDAERARLLQAKGFRASFEAYEALREAADVNDRRNKFF